MRFLCYSIQELVVYDLIDLGFSLFYMCELAINMYGHWFWDFFQSWWNWFDFVVVATSVHTHTHTHTHT
jgi:hypothetical protein